MRDERKEIGIGKVVQIDFYNMQGDRNEIRIKSVDKEIQK